MFKFLLLSVLLDTGVAVGPAMCPKMLRADASLGDTTAVCQISQLANGQDQSTCYWSYPVHARDSGAQFDALHDLIETCVKNASILPPEPGVNHPDTYDQRIYQGQGLRISLSLKRKTALGKAFVFLGISPLP
ncbi:MAG: hypothetical protein AB8B82_02180 [Roseovarius sp.]